MQKAEKPWRPFAFLFLGEIKRFGHADDPGFLGGVLSEFEPQGPMEPAEEFFDVERVQALRRFLQIVRGKWDPLGRSVNSQMNLKTAVDRRRSADRER